MSPAHFVPRTRRDLRFGSGLVLFGYITVHLSCHALGLVSLDAAERALDATVRVWQSLPGTALLYGAAFVHIGLALLAVYERRTLRMPPLQALRIVLGLVMPIALIGHFIGTRYAFERYGIAAEYPRVVAAMWSDGGRGISLGLLAPGWLHGCLGLRFALSTRRWWQRWRSVLFAVALLVPVFAALGFVTMARTVETARADGALRLERVPLAQVYELGDVRDDALAAYVGVVVIVVLARLVRRLDERRRRALVRIRYPGRTVDVPRGWTVLEASRSHGVPHLSACGGRARCSTCRVRILDGLLHCPPAAGDERRTLERIRAPQDVRLACQLRPTGDVAIEPVLAAERAGWLSMPQTLPRVVERDVTLLALEVGIVGDTGPLPAHDAFYVLDRYRALIEGLVDATGGARIEAGSRRWMGVYGVRGAPREGAVRALAAAERLATDVEALDARLQRELGAHARCAIVVHAGPVVVGRIGGIESMRHAAVGHAVDELDAMLAQALHENQRLVRSERARALAAEGAATESQPLPVSQPH
ncbi:MAG TPA: 2Fe-2S iron-sulfur cluster-binding protein [Caldimonas sp.]|nr:2Fe-2S iron-sulfur cluster-binding protein [Caldimonas sp.]